MQQNADSNLDKAVETIWCGDCNYYTQLYFKYGRNIPIVPRTINSKILA